MMLKSIAAVSAGLVGSAHAFWRMECPGRVGLARLDPIIDPGTVSKHVHSIHGSSGECYGLYGTMTPNTLPDHI